jgi:multicomponent Na+:H+ antiporter subunit D
MTGISAMPPGLPLVLGALLLPLFGSRIRAALALGLPLLTLALIWQIPDGVNLRVSFLEYELVPVNGDRLSRLFATVFAIMAFAGGLFALNRTRVIELVAALISAGSAIGVTFAGDLITLLAFWELLALSSTLLVWSAMTDRSYRAGMRYLVIHLLGGAVLMVGIIGHVADTGSVTFTAMTLDSPAQWLMLGGFLLNAGAPPLSAWLPDAYPEASPTGMVFLSAFTTKTAVYVLLRGFPGADILIFIGLYMVFYGIVYALLENDIRRILAYSIVNQVGFMLCGIGIGTELSLNGAAAHAFAHIIYKALLLMSAGSVLYMTGKRKCTDLGGLFRSMPLTTICGIIGALSISAFPLTSGFISKSMISQSAADETMAVTWLLLTAGSAGVFLHAGIKFPWFVFFQKDSGLRPPDPPLNMRLAMILCAFLCIAIGIWPAPLYAILPFPVDYVPYTSTHIVAMLQLLLFSGLAFFIMLPYLKRTLTITLDWDWFYRWLGLRAISKVTQILRRWHAHSRIGFLRHLGHFFGALFLYHGPQGILARTWATGSMVLWVVILLGIYLVAYYY